MLDRPRTAREWSASGFTADSAARWVATEDVLTAIVLENGGWHPRERDLLDLLLIADDRRTRLTFFETPLPPSHVLDYVRAGVGLSEFGRLERLRREEVDVWPDLRARGKGIVRTAAVRYRLDRIVEHFPVLRDGYHAEPYVPGAVDKYAMTVEVQDPVPASWEGPAVIDTWRERGMAVWHRGFGDWMLSGVPEDYAYEPVLDWSEAHEVMVRDAFAEAAGPHEEVDVDWPPTGGLWTAGTVHEEPAISCEEHEEFEPRCWDCEAPEHGVTIEPAEWRWYVSVARTEVREDGDQGSTDWTQHHILSTQVDPRDVEYSDSGALR